MRGLISEVNNIVTVVYNFPNWFIPHITHPFFFIMKYMHFMFHTQRKMASVPLCLFIFWDTPFNPVEPFYRTNTNENKTNNKRFKLFCVTSISNYRPIFMTLQFIFLPIYGGYHIHTTRDTTGVWILHILIFSCQTLSRNTLYHIRLLYMYYAGAMVATDWMNIKNQTNIWSRIQWIYSILEA